MPVPAETAFAFRPPHPGDKPAVRDLVFGVLREYGLQPDPDGTDADLTDLDAHYGGRGGWFEIVTNAAGEIIGSVGLYRIDDDTCELRKMYLRRDARGRGLGRQLLDHAMAAARTLGCRKVTLETASVLQEAIALYERAGFRRVTEGIHSARCDCAMELKL
jgi:GNAT superfamily N-acetyltransferase